mmetsp:Transcript_38960/g.110199  ORF Transcript_38960/g.110199 Transcript_38960/m.110199 type:complete len:265 (+) Transcript_38960:162-956(+)
MASLGDSCALARLDILSMQATLWHRLKRSMASSPQTLLFGRPPRRRGTGPRPSTKSPEPLQHRPSCRGRAWRAAARVGAWCRGLRRRSKRQQASRRQQSRRRRRPRRRPKLRKAAHRAATWTRSGASTCRTLMHGQQTPIDWRPDVGPSPATLRPPWGPQALPKRARTASTTSTCRTSTSARRRSTTWRAESEAASPRGAMPLPPRRPGRRVTSGWWTWGTLRPAPSWSTPWARKNEPPAAATPPSWLRWPPRRRRRRPTASGR